MRAARRRVTAAWLLVIAGTALGASQRAAAEVSLSAGAAEVGRHQKLAFTIGVGTEYANPFDPDEVDVSLIITAPGGRELRLPAFFCQPYEHRAVDRNGRAADWFYPAAAPGWQALFAPAETGTYSCVAELRDRSGVSHSDPVTFDCIPAESPGYVRVSSRDPRFLELSDGRSFFPIGQDVAYVGSGQYLNCLRLERVFSRMGEAGANFARVWTCCRDWAICIEGRKSAWGRSWSWDPPFADLPGQPGRRCVRLSGQDGASIAASPSHPVALAPSGDYVLSGRALLEGGAGVRVRLNGQWLGSAVVPDEEGEWIAFSREFRSPADCCWLGELSLHLAGEGGAFLSDISLKEANGGPELLWEADPDRPVIGVYNQVDCAMLDAVVAAAERHGIRLQLCLLTRDLYMNRLRETRAPEYAHAVHDAQNLLRYAVARWGYSTAVASWEYFNEMDPGVPAARFYAELGGYLDQTDIYGHLRQTSAWAPAPRDWRDGSLDCADLHHYIRPDQEPDWRDEVAVVLRRATQLREAAPDKPALLSEFGLATERWGLSPFMRQDAELVHFHNSLWAAALSGLSGTAMFWWWEQLDQMDAYRHYAPLAAFLKDIPFADGALRNADAAVETDGVRAVGLQTDTAAFLWLQDREATWGRIVLDGAAPGEVRGAELRLNGLEPGTYDIEWWDTYGGVVLKRDRSAHPGGPLTLAVPAFHRDIACRVLRLPDA